MKVKYIFYLIYLMIILIVPCSFFISAYDTSSIEVVNKVKPLVSEKVGVNSISVVQEKEKIVTNADPSALHIKKKQFNLNSITDSLIPTLNIADAKYSEVLIFITMILLMVS